ncbi:IS3 family transposase [Achromobacter spanius]|uniref:IS3 family transposase n=1 Tax=Achromobacter spanius TaxID=217203 RepID=UPI0013DF0071|nr:IS3 family transposase [Achromobacter spanius]
MRYAFVQAHQQQFRVARLCRALQVSRSGYYEWRRRAPCARQQEDVKLLAAIEQTHRAYRQAYGAEKTRRALNASGVACGKHRVARLRRQAGIEALRKQRFRRLEKHSLLGPAPNRLERRFTVHCPNKVWVGDITVVSTRTGWLHLAVLLDLYSRSVVGWSMSDKRDRSLVIQALLMAMTRRKPQPGLMHHSDRGAQYSSAEYRAMLTGNGITISMSAKGDPYDNAVAESFFSNLKNELTHHQVFHSREHARLAIFNYIEVFYNRQRIHQGLGYRTAVQVEAAVP